MSLKLEKNKERRMSKKLDGNLGRFIYRPFGIYIHDKGQGRIRIGIETADERNRVPVSEVEQVCWQDKSKTMNSVYRCFWKKNNVKVSFDKVSNAPRLRSGDLAVMSVDRKRKTIYIRRNEEHDMVLFENIDFPEVVDIYICIEKGADIELTYYHEFFPTIDQKEYEKEGEERLNHVISNHNLFSQISIPLKNKVLHLWKPLIHTSSSSRIEEENNSHSGVIDLQNFSLNVDESLIFKILLGSTTCGCFEKEDIPLENLLSYYILFRSLRITYGIKVVLESISKIKSFEVAYELFSDTLQELEENEDLRSWFSNNQKKIDDMTESSFTTSFALQLFLTMKEIEEEEFKSKPELLTLEYVGFVLFHIRKFEYSEDVVFKHSDFRGVDVSSCALLPTLRRGDLSNVTLICSDGKMIPAHREILAAKTNFFGKMLHFDGVEQDELREKGTIHLENIDSVTCSLILDHVYLGKMEQKNETEKLEVLIRVLVHAHMYSESSLLNDALEHLSTICLPGKILNMKDLLLQENVGCILYGNDNLNKFVVPILRRSDPKLGESGEIYDLIQKSYDMKKKRERTEKKEKFVIDMTQRSEDLESKNRVLLERVDVLEKENLERKRENQELGKKVDYLRKIIEGIVGENKKLE